MTDRVTFLTVALEQNIRADDPFLIGLIDAISRLRGVLKVEQGIADSGNWTVQARERMKLAEKLLDLARELRDSP